MTTLTARPEAITFNPQQTALIVVDIQNAYATPGGYLDLAGFNISTTHPTIANIQAAVTAARTAGMLIIWFRNGQDEQYVGVGGSDPSNYHKSNALKTMRNQPLLQRKLLAEGSWDYQLMDKPVPQPGDMVLSKSRYNGFFNTPLDGILHSRGTRHLVSADIVTNVYVESALRDSFFLEYFGVMLEDATHQTGPEFTREAALFNIETFFDWVSDVETFYDALSSTSFIHIA